MSFLTWAKRAATGQIQAEEVHRAARERSVRALVDAEDAFNKLHRAYDERIAAYREDDAAHRAHADVAFARARGAHERATRKARADLALEEATRSGVGFKESGRERDRSAASASAARSTRRLMDEKFRARFGTAGWLRGEAKKAGDVEDGDRHYAQETIASEMVDAASLHAEAHEEHAAHAGRMADLSSRGVAPEWTVRDGSLRRTPPWA